MKHGILDKCCLGMCKNITSTESGPILEESRVLKLPFKTQKISLKRTSEKKLIFEPIQLFPRSNAPTSLTRAGAERLINAKQTNLQTAASTTRVGLDSEKTFFNKKTNSLYDSQNTFVLIKQCDLSKLLQFIEFKANQQTNPNPALRPSTQRNPIEHSRNQYLHKQKNSSSQNPNHIPFTGQEINSYTKHEKRYQKKDQIRQNTADQEVQAKVRYLSHKSLKHMREHTSQSIVINSAIDERVSQSTVEIDFFNHSSMKRVFTAQNEISFNYSENDSSYRM